MGLQNFTKVHIFGRGVGWRLQYVEIDWIWYLFLHIEFGRLTVKTEDRNYNQLLKLIE